MTPTLRLSDCGDWLTIHQYCAWRGICVNTVKSQIKRGNCFVMPATEQSELRWRRSDCERRMTSADILRERSQGLRRAS